ncbi:ABC transporter permease [Bacillus rugosus]
MKLTAQLAWRFLKARRARSLFAVIGISLGVMLLIISQIMMATLEQSNEKSVLEKYGNFDLISGYNGSTKKLSANDLQTIKGFSDVNQITPMLFPYASENMPAAVAAQPVYIGFKHNQLAMEHPLVSIDKGEFPQSKEVVIPARYAKSKGLDIHSEISLPFPPGKDVKVRVSGILNEREQLNNIFIFDYDWIAAQTHNQNKATAVMMKLDQSADKQKVIEDLKEHFEGISIDKRKAMMTEKEQLGGLKPIVNGLSITVLLGSLLIVVSTLQMSVQERQKELATLRLLGGKPAQLFYMVIWEALLIGIMAALLGTVTGTVLCYSLSNIAEQFIGYSIQSISIPAISIIISFFGSILLTVLAATIPALSTSRLSPIAAYSQKISESKADSKRTIIALTMILLLLAIMTFSVHKSGGSGSFSILLGVSFVLIMFVMTPVILRIIVTVLTFLLRPFYQMESMIAGRNALKRMRRSQQIARVLTLAVIVGLVGFMILQAVVSQTEKTISKQYPLDYVIQATEASYEPGFSSSIIKQLDNTNGVEAIPVQTSILTHTINLDIKRVDTNWNGQFMTINGKKEILTSVGGLNLEKVQNIIPFDIVKGRIDHLRDYEAVITKQFSEDIGFRVGDVVTLEPDDLSEVSGKKPFTLRVVGVVDEVPILPDEDLRFFTNENTLNELFHLQKTEQIFFNIKDQSEKGHIKASIEKLLENPQYQDTILYDRKEEMDKFYQQYKQRIVLLGSSVFIITLIALVGLMNSMASNLRESKKEFAMMRAIGGKPWQIVRLALYEGIVISVAGSIMGLISSIVLGYNLLSALDVNNLEIPYMVILIILLISPLLGILSTLPSALWLSKSNLIRAVFED